MATNDLTRLPTWVDTERKTTFRVVVEAVRGSRAKLAYDPKLDAFRFSRPLPLGLTYPYDWGFVAGTLASDGDPFDAFVLSECATAPGVVIECRAAGVLLLEQDSKKGGRERNDRVAAIPIEVAAEDSGRALDAELTSQLEAFFVNAVRFENKNVKILGWEDERAALELIKKSER